MLLDGYQRLLSRETSCCEVAPASRSFNELVQRVARRLAEKSTFEGD